jgi:molecular chaperone HtpG
MVARVTKEAKKEAAPLKPIEGNIVIGKDILELLSSSMYLDPLTIYREYVQNSADAIEEQSSQPGTVSIFLDPTFRTIRIRDNGGGVPAAEFVKRLTSFGASKKRGTAARGFRGVGRLAGLGYCRELVFRSLGSSERTVRELVWDCRAIRALIQNKEAIDLATVVQKVVAERELPPEGDASPFFEVELRGVVRHRNDQLLNAVAVQDYLSQVAPVPFHPGFSFGKAISATLAPHVRLGELDIRVNGGEPIYRPHRDSFQVSGGLTDKFADIEWLEVPSVDGTELAAVSWFLHHGYTGALPNLTLVKGVRLRTGNVQVGDGNLLEELFVEPRFNSWSVGEIHVLDRRIVPNGRRDHFEQNTHFANVLNKVALVAREISRRCRQGSIERQWLRDFDMHEGTAKEKIEIVRQRSAPKATLEVLLAEARASVAKMGKISGSESFAFLDRPELVRRYESLRDTVDALADLDDSVDPLAALPRKRQEFYREMIQLIYKCSLNRVAAKALVDRILADAGVVPAPGVDGQSITKT